MARPKQGFYSTIEYIGPRPNKPKRQNFFGGWVILLIAVGIGFWFVKPLVPLLNAEDVSVEQAEALIASLERSTTPGNRVAAAALAYPGHEILHDSTYYQISYPNGDLPSGKGYAPDLVIRSLRKVGVDLQQEVHDDMAAHFRLYPQLWNAKGPDTNIDHRRVANLQRFFERKAEVLTTSQDVADYQPGDIVVWILPNADKHIGIVVPGPGQYIGQPWVVHHMSDGVKWENTLFEYKIEAHFRYPAEQH
jgi:uncharacterized protein YijF (DUF1287 family)